MPSSTVWAAFRNPKLNTSSPEITLGRWTTMYHSISIYSGSSVTGPVVSGGFREPIIHESAEGF
jgi:hypothetical protein